MGSIYKITNTANGKVYVGQTNNWERRKNEHKRLLRLGRHDNPHLQAAWDKYGPGSFEFTEVLVCNEDQLNINEQKILARYGGYTDSSNYNLTKTGEHQAMSEETKKKLSEAMMGVKNPFYGKTHSEEVKRIVSLTHKGKTISEAHRRALSKAHKGKVVSEETRKKIGDALRGKPVSDEARRNMSKGQLRRYHKRTYVE